MSTKIRCILLDDELPGLTYLKMLCEQFPEVEIVKAFNRTDAFLKEVNAIDFDLCILDIEMPGMNGLQVANLIKDKPVIFTTAYKEYAAEAFDLNAVDYVRKPITKDRLHQAIIKAQSRIQNTSKPDNFIQLNTDKGKAIIFPEQLVYIRTSDTDSRDKIARLADNSFLTLKNISFEKLNELLPSSAFIRVNKKEIIAIKSVQLFSFDEITTHLTNESGTTLKLTLSAVYRNEFLDKMKS